MAYAGDNVAPITGSFPRYFQPFAGKEGYIFFDNVADEKFVTSAPFSQAMTGKRELWLVMRRPGLAADHEAYLNSHHAGYFSDRGKGKSGLSDSHKPSISLTADVSIPFNVKTLVRIKLDSAKSEIYINNKRVEGPLPGGYFEEGNNGIWEYLVVGASTNNAYWDWYASYYKRGNFTDLQAADVYNALSARHQIGSLPALPYADNARVVRKGDVYSMSYTYMNPLGIPEDTTRTEYQFVYAGRGKGPYIFGAYDMPEMARKSFNRRDYAVGNKLGNPELFSTVDQNAFGWFRMSVKVYDMAGNSWRLQSAPWVVDNEYETTGYFDAAHFDHKYLADSAYVYNDDAARVRDSQRAGRIPDLLGTADMAYAGDNVAPITGSFPRYFRPFAGKEGYIFFDNVADEKFVTSAPLSQPMTGKRELWLVMRRPGLAADHEAYLNSHHAGYFSDRGKGKSGLSDSHKPSISLTADVSIPFNVKTLVRIKLDSAKSEIYINNKRVEGPLPGGYFEEGNNGIWEYLVVGASTNNAYWDWYASYYKRGNFTDLQAADVYNALSARHQIGSLPALPYADNARVVRKGDVYSMSYTYMNPLGIPEDTTRTEYQFVYAGRGKGPYIFGAYDMPEMARKSFNRRDYAVGNKLGNPELFSTVDQNAFGWFRMSVKVYDMAGNSWRLQSAPWVVDNEYETTGYFDAAHFDH